MRSGYLIGQTSLLTEMRQSSWLTGIVGSVVIVAVGGLSVIPTIAIAQQEINQAIAEAGANELSPEAEMSQTVLSLLAELEKVEAKLAATEEEENDEVVDILEEEEALEELTEQLTELDEEVMSGFNDIGVMLKDKDLPDVIVERHAQAVAKYQSELNAVLEGIRQVRETTDRKKRLSQTTELGSRLKSMKHTRSQQHFDPSEMPSRSLQPNKANKPKLTAMEFNEAYPMGDYRQLMANLNGSLPTGEDAFNNPDWLSESNEVMLTQPIRDKANELENDPVKIYHWVRNNIQWNPNWGAKQTAQLTMELGSGNAMDIASLTIGLMRAAGLPARYVHGTIDVPKDKFRNWSGGFQSIESALDYAASGGIPVGPVTSGGIITKVRMEHIWVEVAVDYVPSRAAVNVSPDSWIPIDPSFKQFEYLPGLDLIEISGIDINQVANDYVNSGTFDPMQGSVSDYDTAIIVNAQQQGQQAVRSYIEQNTIDPTIDQTIGGTRTIVFDSPQLGSGLSNSPVGSSSRYSAIPDSLRQKMAFAFGADIFGDLLSPVVLNWAGLNNQKITLSFKPATTDDEAAILGLLPDDEVTSIDQLASSIPAYLVRVIPELRVNGTVVLAGNTVSLGDEIDFRFNPIIVGFGEFPKRYSVIAGSYLSIAAVSSSVSPRILDALEQRLAESEAVLESEDSVALEAIGREQFLGDVFYAGTLGYYGQYAKYSSLLSASSDGTHELAAGLGSVGYEPIVDRIFGIPRSLQRGGIVSNLPMLRVTGVTTDLQEDRLNESKRDLNVQLGYLSSELEGTYPEQMFTTDPQNRQNAVSSTRALDMARLAGQKIYQITADNLNSVLPNLTIGADAISEIVQSVQSGKEVITHANAISVPGWTGAGYIILDPVTGDGAFKISGGQNGEWLQDSVDQLEKVIQYIAAFEKTLGKFGKLGAVLKKVVSQIRKLVKNIKTLIEITLECGAFAVLGVALFLVAMVFTFKVASALVGAVGVGATALCGPICGGLAALTVGAGLAAIVNNTLETIGDDILSGCRGE